MESSGPGLESIISGGLPKSISRHELKMKHIDVGVGLGIGPKIHKTKMIQKKPLFAGEGVSAGLALLARPEVGSSGPGVSARPKVGSFGLGVGCLVLSKFVDARSGFIPQQDVVEMNREASLDAGTGDPVIAKSGPKGKWGKHGTTVDDVGMSAEEGLQASTSVEGTLGRMACTRTRTESSRCTRTIARHKPVSLGPPRENSVLPGKIHHGEKGVLS
jgi:hypothetical protein